MLAIFAIFCGAGLGGVLRYGITVGGGRLLGIDFPWATLAINISGSFVMGMAAAWFVIKGAASGPPEWRLFLTTGVLGGYTTFSTFSLEAVYLWERGAAGQAAIYVLASFVISLAALGAGLALVRALIG